jgi:hypothetical protein
MSSSSSSSTSTPTRIAEGLALAWEARAAAADAGGGAVRDSAPRVWLRSDRQGQCGRGRWSRCRQCGPRRGRIARLGQSGGSGEGRGGSGRRRGRLLRGGRLLRRGKLLHRGLCGGPGHEPFEEILRVDALAEVVAAEHLEELVHRLEEDVDQRLVDDKGAIADLREERLGDVGEPAEPAELEEPGRAFDRVDRAEDLVDGLRIGRPLQREKFLLGQVEILAALGDELLQEAAGFVVHGGGHVILDRSGYEPARPTASRPWIIRPASRVKRPLKSARGAASPLQRE